MKRLNKEYKLNVNEKFSTKYGSVNSKNPEVIYMIINTYISPSFISENYDDSILKLKSNILKSINSDIKHNAIFSNKSIINLELCESGIKYGKKSFFHAEVYLFQNKLNNLKENYENMKSICNSICNLIEKKC